MNLKSIPLLFPPTQIDPDGKYILLRIDAKGGEPEARQALQRYCALILPKSPRLARALFEAISAETIEKSKADNL